MRGEKEASATFPDKEQTPADQSDAFLVLVNNTIQIVTDDLQWLVQSKKIRTTAKSSGWRSRISPELVADCTKSFVECSVAMQFQSG